MRKISYKDKIIIVLLIAILLMLGNINSQIRNEISRQKLTQDDTEIFIDYERIEDMIAENKSALQGNPSGSELGTHESAEVNQNTDESVQDEPEVKDNQQSQQDTSEAVSEKVGEVAGQIAEGFKGLIGNLDERLNGQQ